MKSLLLIALSLPLCAAEGDPLLVDHDVRVTLSALPRSYDATLENHSNGFSGSTSDTLDSAGSIAFDYQASLHHDGPVSLLLGAGLDFIGMQQEDSTEKDTVSGFGVHGDIGASYRATSIFSIEGSVALGFGGASSSIDFKGTGPSLNSNSGDYTMAGIFVRPVVTFKPGFQLFGQLGYVGYKFTTKYDQTSTTGNIDQTVNIKGATYGLGLGWRF